MCERERDSGAPTVHFWVYRIRGSHRAEKIIVFPKRNALQGARCASVMQKHALKRNPLLEYGARSLYMWEFAHLEVRDSVVEGKTTQLKGVG